MAASRFLRVVQGGALEVTIEDKGLAPMPVRLAITRSGGQVERQTLPVDVWLAGARTTTISVANAATIESVEIDPESKFTDIDRSNNRWAASPSPNVRTTP